MISSNFQLVFKLEVFHTYFDKNSCRCLEFNPGDATGTLITRFGFKMKANTNGFEFYSNSSQALDSLLTYIERATGQTYFDFDIVTNDPQFNNFTELPVNWAGQLLYDSRKVSDNNGTVLLMGTLSDTRSIQVLGNLKLYFKDIMAFLAEYGYVQFNISYKARSTQWQYYIINTSAVPLNNSGIAGKTGINFSGPETVNIATGQQALFFSSGNTFIPLSERPVQKFDLVNKPVNTGNGMLNKSPGPKIIFKGLPNPDPKWNGNVVIDTVNRVSSPMYVYV